MGKRKTKDLKTLEKKKTRKDENPSRKLIAKKFFPNDLVMEILARLPLKSLARFRCVNKSLNYSRDFMTKLAIRESKNPYNHNFLCLFAKSIYTVNNLATKVFLDWYVNKEWAEPEFVHPLLRDEVGQLVGSCHGLVCVVYSAKEFVLFNPLTGEGSRLFRRKWLRACPIFYGLGYDISNEDYKIVRIEDKSYKQGHGSVIDIFSLKNNCWKDIIQLQPPIPIKSSSSTRHAIHVSGVLHWEAQHSYNDRIVAFDLAEEKFGELMVPNDELDENSIRITGIGALQGRLCISQGVKKGYVLWMMKEYGVKESWTKFITINDNVHSDVFIYYGGLLPLCYTKDGELLMQNSFNYLVIYNPKDESIYTCRRQTNAQRWISYVKSLVSPNYQNA